MSMMLIWSSAKASSADTLTFTFGPVPSIKFTFDQPTLTCHPPYRPFKRRRALSDVDGDGNEGRKKRRLRLHLITSRLSRPFSQPATNIVNRGTSKLAAWSRNKKVLGKADLRKAAIMNRVRLSMDAAKNVMRQEQERSRALFALRHIVPQKPRFYDMPLPPSPLGLSNYDALDLEDEMSEEDDTEDGIQRTSSIYSDFNIMNPVSGDGDDYDYLDALDGIQPEDLPDTPPQPLEGEILEILKEKERHGDAYFVRYGSS